MTKEFVTYEQALALKELGFDEPCFGYWKSKNWLIQEKTRTDGYTHADQECSAPTFSQAFRWFREKYGYLVSPFQNEDNLFFFEIGRLNSLITEYYSLDCETYEEAELACLRKLIELVKQK